MKMVSSVPVALQAIMIMMMGLWYASECGSEYPKLPGGACPPDPPRVNGYRAAMFSTSTLPPQIEKLRYGPAVV